MIITIGGTPGSGKSTLAKMLAVQLGYERFYAGGLRRDMARERGLTLHDLNTLGENEDWTDRLVDQQITELAQKHDNIIIEGRTAYHFAPQSLKIFIDVDPRIGAERVFQELRKPSNTRNEDRDLSTIDAVHQSHQERIRSDIERYRKYYGIDVYDRSQYDFVLDTSSISVEESYKRLWSFVSAHLANESGK